MISMIVAFIFSMAISYNAYANEKINLREFSAYIGDFSEQKYDVIEQKVMELQNKYEETQNADVMNEMFVNNPVSMSPLSGDRKPQIRF